MVRPKPSIPIPLRSSIKLVKAFANARFDETVDIVILTGLDPRKPGQQLRGSCALPHGSGKSATVAVFATGEKAEEALKAGADRVGGDDLVAEIASGKVEYTRVLATPNMMPTVAKVARVLGPRGLMPNPKQGEVQFKAEMKGQIFCPVGKASWPVEKLEENIYALVQKFYELQPPGARGKYIRGCSLSSSQGSGVRTDITDDPFWRKLRPEDYPEHMAHLAPEPTV